MSRVADIGRAIECIGSGLRNIQVTPETMATEPTRALWESAKLLENLANELRAEAVKHGPW